MSNSASDSNCWYKRTVQKSFVEIPVIFRHGQKIEKLSVAMSAIKCIAVEQAVQFIHRLCLLILPPAYRYNSISDCRWMVVPKIKRLANIHTRTHTHNTDKAELSLALAELTLFMQIKWKSDSVTERGTDAGENGDVSKERKPRCTTLPSQSANWWQYQPRIIVAHQK